MGESLKDLLLRLIKGGFKSLLEGKHLYQSIKVDLTEAETRIERSKPPGKANLRMQYAALLGLPWDAVDRSPADLSEIMSEDPIDPVGALVTGAVRRRRRTQPSHLEVELPSVKLYCAECKRVEAYNPDGDLALVVVDTRLPETGSLVLGPALPPLVHQTFALAYQCQSCKGVPEVFLVQRVGFKLTLCGRKPIEEVPVPDYIPKDQRKYFSNAIVAHQSGQTLAGLFLLRTLIEQYCLARRDGGNSATAEAEGRQFADELIDEYTKPLPEDFKDRFPSFRKLYDDLSAAIHNASEDADLFDRVHADILKHFDARRLFEL